MTTLQFKTGKRKRKFCATTKIQDKQLLVPKNCRENSINNNEDDDDDNEDCDNDDDDVEDIIWPVILRDPVLNRVQKKIYKILGHFWDICKVSVCGNI